MEDQNITTNQEIQIQCRSTLSADTPILIDNTIKTMRDIYLFQSGKPLPTFALNFNDDKALIEESEIIGIPQELYVNSIIEIIFSTGFHFEAGASSMILTDKGFIPISSLKAGDSVVGVMFNEQIGIQSYNTTVESISTKQLSLGQPVYLFCSKHQNILLPKYDQDTANMYFVCIGQ